MKIIYITDALAIWGGMERIIVEKVDELTKRYGYEMFLITTNQGDHPIPFPLHPLVAYHDLDICFYKQYQFSGIRRLLKKLELKRLFHQRMIEQISQIKPDLIVCCRADMAEEVAKVKGNIPLVFESHTSRNAQRFVRAGWYTRMKEEWYNRSVRFACQVVALTKGDAQDWRQINPNVCVIPNIVHLNPLSRTCNYDAKSVIFVGRFHAQKDIRSLLKIWFLVYQRHPDWTLHIFGGYGEEQNILLPQIQQMNANIVVHEPTDDIFNRYLESSIFLLTSIFEPFGLVLPEAMSCGLPVVAFDCPYGPADIITDGKDGFLIKNRDINVFVEKTCLLIENPELRKTMGQAGVQSAKRYDASLIMPLWKELFESVVAI